MKIPIKGMEFLSPSEPLLKAGGPDAATLRLEIANAAQNSKP